MRLCVAFRAVVPLLAARCTDGDLRIEDMFAGKRTVGRHTFQR